MDNMDNSKVCQKHKSHQKTNTNSQKSKQSESWIVFIQFSVFFSSMFLLFYNYSIFLSPPIVSGSLKSKDSGLSPEPSYEKYHAGSDFMVS